MRQVQSRKKIFKSKSRELNDNYQATIFRPSERVKASLLEITPIVEVFKMLQYRVDPRKSRDTDELALFCFEDVEENIFFKVFAKSVSTIISFCNS